MTGDFNTKISASRAEADQLWMTASEYETDISRIAEHGPTESEFDIKLCRSIFHLVRAEIILRGIEADII